MEKVRGVATNRSHTALRKDLKKWLTRLGVNESDIEILTGVGGEGAKVSYVFNGKRYELTSTAQIDITNNLAALELLVHSRVLSIERRIETVEQAFAGYKILPAAVTNPYHVLGLQDGAEIDIVKAVYKKLAVKLHPDTGGDTEEFKRITAAYETIQSREGK